MEEKSNASTHVCRNGLCEDQNIQLRTKCVTNIRLSAKTMREEMLAQRRKIHGDILPSIKLLRCRDSLQIQPFQSS